MIKRVRFIVLLPVIIIALIVSGLFARSFLDQTPPQVSLVGVEENGHYAGEVSWKIIGSDNLKVSDISIWLDGKPLVSRYKIGKKSFEYVFPLATNALPEGKHLLKIIVTDSSSHKNETVKELSFNVDNVPLAAAFVKPGSDYRVFQGRTLHVQFQVNKDIEEATIEALSEVYPCIQEATGSQIYECFFPIKCEEIPQENIFKINVVDKVGNKITLENKFHVIMYPFKKQVLTLNTEKVEEENKIGKPESVLEAELAELAKKSPLHKYWHGSFYVPTDSKGSSCDFGTLRTAQERGKYRHNAIDLLGTPRGVIWAPQDGIVVLKDRFAHSGNTLVIDHGCGILSLFFHLDSFADINVGDTIKKGKPIGKLGKTGYATGYHLHWEMRINNIQIDPMQWTQHDF